MIVLLGPVAKFAFEKVAKKTIKKVIGQKSYFARVTTFQGQPDKLAEAAEQVEKHIQPGGRKLKGAKGGYMLVEGDSGKVITITLWRSQEDLEASAEWAAESMLQTAQAIGATAEPEIEVFEAVIRPED